MSSAQETGSPKHSALAHHEVPDDVRQWAAHPQVTFAMIDAYLGEHYPDAFEPQPAPVPVATSAPRAKPASGFLKLAEPVQATTTTIDPVLPVAYFDNTRDRQAKCAELPWRELAAVLVADPMRRATKDGRLFSVTRYAPSATRGNAGVQALGAVVLDFDDGTTPEVIAARIGAGTEYVTYPTYSDHPRHRKFRAVIPLREPCTPDQWPQLWRAVSALLGGGNDASRKDVAGIFYLPSHPTDADAWVLGHAPVKQAKACEMAADWSPEPAAPMHHRGIIRTAGEWLDEAKASGIDVEARERPAKAPEAVDPADPFTGFSPPAHALVPRADDPHEIAKVRAALSVIPASVERAQWLRVIWAVAAHNLAKGEALARNWSQGCADKFDEEAFTRDFSSFKPGQGHISTGTLYELAKQYAPAVAASAQGATVPTPDAVATPALGSEARAALCTTDLCLAERFARENHAHLRWVPETGQWLGWQGSGWSTLPDKAPEVHSLLKTMLRSVVDEAVNALHNVGDGKQITRAVALLESRKLIDNVLELVKREPAIVVPVSALDNNPMLLRCRNAVVDLRTGAAVAAQATQFMTRCAAVDFDPAASCPLWEKTIFECCNGDEGQANVLRMFFGLATSGLHHFKGFLVLFGARGNNGKTLIVETLYRIMGTYAVSLSTGALMQPTSPGAASPERMALDGARLAKTSEWPKSARIDVQFLKDLTGGDSFVARDLYAAPRTIRPGAKLMVVGNHRPIISEATGAIWERTWAIPFNRTFSAAEQDRDLMEKLKAEAPGILNWGLRGLRDALEGKLRRTAAMEEFRDDWRRDSDPLAEWREACTHDHGDGWTPRSDLQRSYLAWCVTNGRQPMSANALYAALEERGYTPAKRGGNRGFTGLALGTPPAA